MTLLELIILVVIAAIAGAIGQSLGGYRRGGFFLAAVLGFVGAFIGAWLARNLGLPTLLEITVGGVQFPLIWAIVGAALLVALVGFLGSGRYRWSITPPTRAVLILSILLAALAILVSSGVLSVSLPAFTLLAVAYLLLLLGNLFKGL